MSMFTLLCGTAHRTSSCVNHVTDISQVRSGAFKFSFFSFCHEGTRFLPHPRGRRIIATSMSVFPYQSCSSIYCSCSVKWMNYVQTVWLMWENMMFAVLFTYHGEKSTKWKSNAAWREQTVFRFHFLRHRKCKSVWVWVAHLILQGGTEEMVLNLQHFQSLTAPEALMSYSLLLVISLI